MYQMVASNESKKGYHKETMMKVLLKKFVSMRKIGPGAMVSLVVSLQRKQNAR